MVAKIIKAISKTLSQAFGRGYEIYFSRDVQQGLKEPCFFIAHVGSSRIRRVGQRYLQANSFAVQYFPKTDRGNMEMVGVAERLLGALETVQLADGGLIRGSEMNFSIQDGVLQFFVDYDVFLRKETDWDGMEEITVDAYSAGEG